jgi:PPOX class probable F420-dependent enzyme
MNKLNSQITPHIAKRLQEEAVIWLTTVSADGTPQPNPVWFYWDGASFWIYTPPTSAKLKNIARNPRVSLNFEGAEALGGDVVVFTGEAQVEDKLPESHPGYVAKYKGWAMEWGRTPEDLYTEYSTTLRVVPTKVRVF